MSARTHNFRIGLFVLAGAFLLIAALFAMGLRDFFGQQVLFETYVPGQVDNLSVGALVKLRGVTIGKVKSIDFVGTEYPEYAEQAVAVCFEVPKTFRWSNETNNLQAMLDAEAANGLRARVQNQGFLGANIVSLEYVDPALYPIQTLAWKPKHYYIPSAPSQFSRLLTSVEKSLHRVEDLDLAGLFDRLQKLIGVADRLVRNINEVNFTQLGTNANSLIVEFRDTNRGIQGTLADARGVIKGALSAIDGADIPGLRRDTATLEARFSSDALELRKLLSGLDIGELNNTLANVRSATDELIVLLGDLQQQPSSVLFSKPPKPAPELEKPPKK